MIPICTAAQMREIDRVAIEDYGIAGVVLMEAAGRGAVDVICERLDVRGRGVAILCGGGNNGGDGFVIARHLVARGADVSVLLLADRAKIVGDADANLRVWERMRGELIELRTPEQLAAEGERLAGAAVIVDAMLGTGLNSEVRGQYRRVIDRVNKLSAMKVAVDIPTGLDSDTGEVLGAVLSADHTVTFAFPKVGLVSHPGVEHVGELHVVDIGVPAGVERDREFAARLLEEADLRELIRPRPLWGHKGTFGHLLVIAGSEGKTGAGLLCSEAALRSGVGLCTVAPPPAVMSSLEAKTLETMLAPLMPSGAELDDSDELFEHLAVIASGKSAVAVGPGIPTGEGAARFVSRLVRESELPLVIDADGLNALAGRTDCLSKARAPVLLTPHPGEMSRLVERPVSEIQRDRLDAAKQLARERGVHVALKGARTVLANPDGEAMINSTGNPGMGSGGTGDVLTGLAGGFLAQRHPPGEALALAVYLHGAAGDRAATRYGQRAMIARDLMEEIPNVLREWEHNGR